MITIEGYSKDKTIRPDGIVITFGAGLLKVKGGMKKYLSSFLTMMEKGHVYGYLLRVGPRIEVDHIYFVVGSRLWGRAKLICSMKE